METIDRLMDAAESAMRQRGYHAVSFRELAEEIGVKSASVHYYFRHKEALGVALVTRYREQFFETLNARLAETTWERLAAYKDAYRAALTSDERLCLCGVLGAERGGLPAPVASAVADFFRENIAWLMDAAPSAWSESVRRAWATRALSTLQGALIVASTLDDDAVFDAAVAGLIDENADV